MAHTRKKCALFVSSSFYRIRNDFMLTTTSKAPGKVFITHCYTMLAALYPVSVLSPFGFLDQTDGDIVRKLATDNEVQATKPE